MRRAERLKDQKRKLIEQSIEIERSKDVVKNASESLDKLIQENIKLTRSPMRQKVNNKIESIAIKEEEGTAEANGEAKESSDTNPTSL